MGFPYSTLKIFFSSADTLRVLYAILADGFDVNHPFYG
jgi:hypothetical protein